MILIVGHGPSVCVSQSFVDKQRVVRLRRAIPFIGTRTDVICSSQERYEKKGIEFWLLKGGLMRLCVNTLRRYSPSFWKPSTGLAAAIIARDKYPKEDIGVIGFDYTLHPERAKHWRHDAKAECECINGLNVIELGEIYGSTRRSRNLSKGQCGSNSH